MPVLAPDLAFTVPNNVNVYWTTQVLQYISATYSFTATNASPCVFTPTPTSMTNPVTLSNGNIVQLTGTMPTGFTANTTYYVVAATQTTFQLALTPGGTAINSTSTGNGTVTQIVSALGYD